jgi:hypothetical protein
VVIPVTLVLIVLLLYTSNRRPAAAPAANELIDANCPRELLS